MGSGNDWLELAQTYFPNYYNILVNLPGHGETALPVDVNFTEILSTLTKQLKNTGIEKFIPIGYSMGGRLAFHLHQLAPERIPALVFLSSAPGLKTRSEQRQRRLDDSRLLDKLERIGFSDFIEEWYSAGLFGDIKNSGTLYNKLYHARSNNDIEQLRQALELMGNGALPSLWDHLEDIAVPTLLMTGALDSKYFQLNHEIQGKISGSIHKQVADAGHAFHLEKPLETAQIMRHFLSEIFEGE